MSDRRKLFQRRVVKRVPSKGPLGGETFVLTLSCGHVTNLSKQAGGHVALSTHCPKCELGLVRA